MQVVLFACSMLVSRRFLVAFGDCTRFVDVGCTHQDDITAQKQERIAQKDQMTIAINKIKDATAGCDYILLNYMVRLTNREAEIDGLSKAKAILQGGEFSDGPDPNREMKPGDA